MNNKKNYSQKKIMLVDEKGNKPPSSCVRKEESIWGGANYNLKIRITFLSAIMLHIFFFYCSAIAGVPQVSEIMVTDITTKSFSVIWISSEPGTADLQVFDSPECTNLTSTPIKYPHPVLSADTSIAVSAKDKGIMKVMVTGLEPDTEYCYRTVTTSKSTSEESIFPNTPLLVRTRIKVTRTYKDANTDEIMPFTNDIIIFSATNPDGITDMKGCLLVLRIVGNDYPINPNDYYTISTFVGDGIISPDGLIDFNNVFSPNIKENLDIMGGEVIYIEEYRGNIGKTLNHYRKIPLDNELSEIKDAVKCYSADMDCSGEVNIIDFQRVLNYFNLKSDVDKTSFNYDIDIVEDGEINILDAQHILNRFGQKEPF